MKHINTCQTHVNTCQKSARSPGRCSRQPKHKKLWSRTDRVRCHVTAATAQGFRAAPTPCTDSSAHAKHDPTHVSSENSAPCMAPDPHRSHASHHAHAPRSPVPSPRLPADDRTFAPIRADQPGRATYWSTRDSLSRPTSMLKTASVMFLMASISVTGARLTTGKLDSSSRERERRRDRETRSR